MAQHAILRFEKHKATRQGRWKPITKDRKNNTPATPTLTQAGASTTFISSSQRAGTIISFKTALNRPGAEPARTAHGLSIRCNCQPGVFQGEIPKEIQAFFQRAADFLIGRVGRENIVSAVVHMDEKTPHLHLTFVPLTKDNRLCARRLSANRANLTKWQDDFHAYMVEKYPDLGRGESASRTGRKHIPHPAFQTGGFPLPAGKSH